MREDRGTAAVEMAIALLVLLLIVIGTYEYGTAFVDRNAMANAAREGARAGTAAGDFDPPGPNNDADCIVIEAAAGALQGMEGNVVRELWIYRSDDSGAVTEARQVYRRPIGSDTVDLVCAGGNWSRQFNAWPPTNRELGSNQWLGVKLIVDHTWKTGFAIWNGTTTWEEDVVMRLEPSAG
jgi:hypothetical protein